MGKGFPGVTPFPCAPYVGEPVYLVTLGSTPVIHIIEHVVLGLGRRITFGAYGFTAIGVNYSGETMADTPEHDRRGRLMDYYTQLQNVRVE